MGATSNHMFERLKPRKACKRAANASRHTPNRDFGQTWSRKRGHRSRVIRKKSRWVLSTPPYTGEGYPRVAGGGGGSTPPLFSLDHSKKKTARRRRAKFLGTCRELIDVYCDKISKKSSGKFLRYRGFSDVMISWFSTKNFMGGDFHWRPTGV